MTTAFSDTPRVQDAEIRSGEKVATTERLKQYEFTLGTAAGFYKGSSVLFRGDEHRSFTEQFFFLYGVSDSFQLRADLVLIDANNTLVDPEHFYSFGDTHLHGRFPIHESGAFQFGLETGIHLFAGIPEKTDFIDGASVSVRQTGSWNANVVRVHYNAGAFYDRSKGVLEKQPTLMESTTYGFSGYSHLKAGLRVDAPLGLFDPFLEYTAQLPLGAPVPAMKGPQWLTPGVALRLFDSTTVNLSTAIGLTHPREPGIQSPFPWTVQLGAAYRFDLTDLPYRLGQMVKPESTVVTVRTLDVLTNLVLPNTEVLLYTPTGVVVGRGGLTWSGFADTVTYTVSLKDYLPVSGIAALRGGQSFGVTVNMTPVVGWAKGTLVNRAGTEPVAVYFNGETTPSVSGLGPFQWSFAPGKYMGYATAPNAVSAPVIVAVGVGQTVDLGRIVTLKPKPVDPIITIPELPPESAPERQAAVADLIQKLNEVNAATVKINETRQEEFIPLPDYGMNLDDFAQNGSSVAEFAPGSWVLSADAKSRIKALAQLLIKNADTIRYVLIQGSADDIGSMEVNTVISRQRAQAVFEELLRNGVSDEKMGMKISVFVRPPRQLTVKDKNSERKVVIRVSRLGEE